LAVATGIRQALRPYQAQAGRTVLESVLRRQGLTFTVEIARQGGKNELSAQMELLLLTLHMVSGGNLVKASPTFVPQAHISMARLRERLNDAGFTGAWASEAGHIIRLGNARAFFFSAEPSANVVGATAHLLLEVDEAQAVDREKFFKEFRPMGASTNVTTVLYGTPWDQHTLLEEMKQENLELEHRDGIRRHFRYDWEEVARHNPLYRLYVEAERARLGEDHPLFRTQYRLLPLAGGGGLFTPAQRAQLQGDHPRQRRPTPGKTCVAAIDVGGEAFGTDPQNGGSNGIGASQPWRDATVVTIGELDFSTTNGVGPGPRVNVVQHYRWVGEPHHRLLPLLADLLRNVWRCRRVVVDATGIGAGLASLLGKALGGIVEPFVFTAASKSRLGFELLAAVNSGRLKLYAADGSPEHQEFWRQVELAQGRYRPNQTMDFFVEPSRGHDDFLMSLALLVKASEYLPRQARGRTGD
jgi:hypothetical protein